MNNKLLRVLEQLEMGDHASLICELPGHLLKDVEVDESGQVDLAGLLTLCKHLSSAEASEVDEFHDEILAEARQLSQQEEEAFQRSSFWFRMIYDQSLAVDPLSVRH